MAVNKYIISPRAAKDIGGIIRWYEEQSVRLGEGFIIELRSKLRRIMKYPDMYKPVIKNVRRYKMRRFPYLIFYTIQKDLLIILRVRHSKQKPLNVIDEVIFEPLAKLKAERTSE